MGHTRLGTLPRTRSWEQVVALIENGAGAPQVANATIRAAEEFLQRASNDTGLIETFWLLTQLPLAARTDNFSEALRQAGLAISDTPDLMELTRAFSLAIDERLADNRGRTDLGEMAQNAATEVLTKVGLERSERLFDTTPEDVRIALAGIGTSAQFGHFTRLFFSRLINKCLGYFLSRTLPLHVGEDKRFTTLEQHRSFCQALDLHCHQAALIVDGFGGQWFSKTNYEKKGISRTDASRFARVAVTKLCAELKEGAVSDAA